VETKLITIRKLFAAFATVIPCFCTSCGRSGVASCSLFCTCTWAMSGSASASKVRVMLTLPEESLVADM
jgi:hypothetical protein